MRFLLGFLRIAVSHVLLIVSIPNISFCQASFKVIPEKKTLEEADLENWPYLDADPVVSKDGNYFMCELMNRPVGSKTLIVRSTNNSWQLELIGISINESFFSGNSKHLVFQNNDSLYFFSLQSHQEENSIPNVSVVRFPYKGDGRWCAYQLNDNQKRLVLHDFYSSEERSFNHVTNFWFNKTGSALLLDRRENDSTQYLEWVDLNTRISNIIGKGLIVKYVAFSNEGNQSAFFANKVKENNIGSPDMCVWYYKEGMEKAVEKVNAQSIGIPTGLKIESSLLEFSENDKWIFFSLQDMNVVESAELESYGVKIWSYKDKFLLPDQLWNLNPRNRFRRYYRSVVSIDRNNVLCLESEKDYSERMLSGDFAIVSGVSFPDMSWWSLAPPHPACLISLKDSSKRYLNEDSRLLSNYSFSPGGRWLIYYNNKKNAFFSYDLKSYKELDITKAIPTTFENGYSRDLRGGPVSGVVAWLQGDSSFLLYDNYDIWRIDPSGKYPAVNVTNGYGKKHNVKLRLFDGIESKIAKRVFSLKDTLLIIAFSPVNKFNGFCKKAFDKQGDPEILFMGPYTFYRTPSQKAHWWAFSNGMQPIKADSANVWIVSKETTTESCNFFVTKDFKTFKPLTDIHPERNCNWLTADLVSWKQLDGTFSQGVLYKPENFDPKRKYPLIFNYYESVSHRLYEFPTPEFSRGDINIPWFVSRGYLVFTPDIHFKSAAKTGKTTSEYAYNAIISAAHYLMKLPYVNAKKMAIQGHSFGGGETNYIVTHSNLFTAANVFAGNSDQVSSYLTLVAAFGPTEHFTKQELYETGQGRIGATLWERPDLYLKQSAVLNADKVTTPLLIVHNENDNNISWRQGLEFYMALRRQGKKVWMLQYNAGHTLSGKNAKDFTIRLTQFFDYFLKDSLPPKWMTESWLENFQRGGGEYQLDTDRNKP